MQQNNSISFKIAQQLNIPRWSVHIIYWLVWISFWALMWGTFDNDYYKTFYIQIVELPFKLLMVYPVIYWLIPKYLLRHHYLKSGVIYLILLFGLGILMKLMWYFFIDPIYFVDRLAYGPLKFTELLNVTMSLNTAVVLPIGIKLTESWMFHQNKSNALEKQKLQAELKFLRTQVNPHFLFNGLNSIYALSLKKSEHTSETIERLAEIMRYIIYEASEALVSFEKEIKFIENYIEFEKIRFDDDLDLSFSVHNTRQGKIPPLLFIPLIENAFKHIKQSGNEKAWIIIQIEASDNNIKLFVENSKYKQSNDNSSKGIGLSNLVKRLEILYPEKYELFIEEKECSFQSVLNINETSTNHIN